MPSGSQHPRESPARRQRRRRTHQRIDSNGELLPRSSRAHDDDLDTPSPGRRRRERHPHRSHADSGGQRSSKYAPSGVSSDQLAQLDKMNRKLGWSDYDAIRPQRKPGDENSLHDEHDDDSDRERRKREEDRARRRREQYEKRRRRQDEEEEALAGNTGIRSTKIRDAGHYDSRRRSREVSGRSRTRMVSGQALERQSHYYDEKESYREDARALNGSSSSDDPSGQGWRGRWRRWKKVIIFVIVAVLLLCIIIPVAVVMSRNNDTKSTTGGSSTSGKPSNSNLEGLSSSSVPTSAQGTWQDPFSWYDTTDFNVTYTDQMVGGLPVIGLFDTWNDDTRANDKVPALKNTWEYGKMPVRGVNVGGWLSIEPFITPSMFSGFNTRDNVVDEYTLSAKLGPSKAKSTIEKHYSAFVSEQTFADIQAAGFDHVRIPFGYWAVKTYDGDPYVAQVAWRYLLRAIEWARKHGLRINLDLHGAPGSQNGWNHSGRQGAIGWLNGTDGALNGQRTIDIHKQLSAFFAQPRYKNIITMYGLVNEPRMTALDQATVVSWTQSATDAVRANKYNGVVIFGDGFRGLDKWQGKLQSDSKMLLDVHQYVIFNVDLLLLTHHDKIKFACGGWTQQALRSQDKTTGFGPTLCGEWSQADTDCAQYLNNVGVGSRWEGNLNMAMGLGGGSTQSVLSPACPTKNNPQCQCGPANADPSSYSAEYKQWLLMFAEAQMHSFEQGWGWFYWTWQTESAAQWSYKTGLANGILPKLAFEREFDCSQSIPDFKNLPENY